MKRRPAVLLVLLLALPLGAGGILPAAAADAPEGLLAGRAPGAPNVDDAQVRDAIARGLAYLVGAQNADGSWGSPAPTLVLDIYAPGKGSQDAFQVGSCALALSGLLDADDGSEAVARAIHKGTDWLLAHHEARRDRADVIYNTWAHAYSLEAFGRLLERDLEPARRAAVAAAAKAAVDRLVRYEYVDGGWGYYDFGVGSRTPSYSEATSFTTATALVGLRRVADAGVEVPARIVRRATRLIDRCRLPGGAYAYSFDFRFYKPWGVNKPEGSLARTPACLAGLLAWDEPVPPKRAIAALDALERDGHFLRIARKYPYPHESWFQNSGYFCFYGYYYAGLLLEHVPPTTRAFHRQRIAAHLVALQEKDGAWWDYQLYGYHRAYGTGFVLMTLARCLEGEAVPEDVPATGDDTPPADASREDTAKR